MPDYDFVLFDLDGTLVSSDGMFLEAMIETLRQAGMKKEFDPEPALHRHRHGSLAEQFGDAVSDYAAAGYEPLTASHSDLVANLRSVIKKSRVHYLRALPGAFELLELCVHNKKPVWAATNGQTGIAADNLGHVGMSRLLPGIAAVDLVEKPKPSPDMLFLAMKELGVSRGMRGLMIGDSDKDLGAARAADYVMKSFDGNMDCAIVGPLHDPFDPQLWIADGAIAAFRSLAELKDWLVERAGWSDPDRKPDGRTYDFLPCPVPASEPAAP